MKIRFLRKSVLDSLKENIENNLEKYRTGDFDYLAEGENNWGKLNLDYDPHPLETLIPKNHSQSEIHNSLAVWRSLSGLTPDLACEESIWAYFSHVDLLDFCRERWLNYDNKQEDIKKIRTRFFAKGTRGYRDLNAISRYWWNGYIASIIDPENMEEFLEGLLAKSDIRKNIIQRPTFSSRRMIIKTLVRRINNDEDLKDRDVYREALQEINKYGSGMLFEAHENDTVEAFVDKCIEISKR
jgi:hypothetical protein